MSRRGGSWISLTGLGRLLLLGSLVAGGLAVFSIGAPLRFPRIGVAGEQQAPAQVARRLITYRLDPVRPTLFRFNQPLTLTRIITQPVLAPSTASPGEAWTYAIKVEMLDEAGTVIEAREVNLQTILLEADGSRRGAVRYYRGSNDVLPPSDETRVAGTRPFAAVRITAGSASPDVIAIDVRVSEQRPLIESAAESAFVRYSPEDRARLSAANAFPAELLTLDEKVAIARNQWRPVGPVGIDGRDYRMNVLYEEVSTEPQVEADEAPLAEPEVGG